MSLRSWSKKCFVPNCQSTSLDTPNKVFVKVRECLKKEWCCLLNINYISSRYYCCEDHLNLEEDLENYYYWKLMKGRPILKPTATLKLNTVMVEHEEEVIKEENEDDDCELVEELETKPIVDLLETSSEELTVKDPLAIPTEPPTVKYMKALENFKVNLYKDIEFGEIQDKTHNKCEKRKQTILPRPDSSSLPSTSKELGNNQSRVLNKGEPRKIIIKTPHRYGVTTKLPTTANTNKSLLKPKAPVLYKLLASEDTIPTTKKLDTPKVQYNTLFTRNVGTQHRVATRDACVGFNGRRSLPIGFKKPKPSLIEDGTDVEVLDLTEPCGCCLFRPSDKYLNTLYTDTDRSEIYSDMLEECFGIQIASDGECGICEECVGRLRDARDFKRQVRRSQQRLRPRLEHPGQEEDISQLLDAEADADTDCLDNEEVEEPPIPLPEIPVIVRDDGLYECGSCHKTFKREAGLKSHILVHYQQVTQETQDNPELDNCEVYTCDECGSEFEDLIYYNEHVKSHESELYNPHPNEMTDDTREQIPDEMETSEDESYGEELSSEEERDSDSEEYSCHLCDKEFTRKTNYISHLMKHESPFKCDICQREFFDEVNLARHKRWHAGEMYICDMCKKKFYDKKQLTAHILLLHMNIKPYSCKICNKRFKYRHYLKVHTLGHIEDKKYSCGVCNKRFGHELLRSRHELRHTNELHVCENCGKQFDIATLEVHIRRTHIGEKPFKCTICEKRFFSKCNLDSHFRTHTGVKPYKCDLCPRKFSSSSYLIIHKRMHTGEKPFSCELCDKKFVHSSARKLHMSVHTGERPHTCKLCGKRFTRRQHLKRHLDIHKERTYYSCPYCPKVYSHKNGFQQHTRNHKKGLI